VLAERLDIGVLVLSAIGADGVHSYRVYQHGILISVHQHLRQVASQLNYLTAAAES
jgi:hypothetical protein